MTLADYRRFLPGLPSLRRLVAFARNYLGFQFAWDLNLVLRREQVPALRLDGGGQLGWTTWLPAARFERDPADLVIEPERWQG
jgi:type VI secretion system protein ImpH